MKLSLQELKLRLAEAGTVMKTAENWSGSDAMPVRQLLAGRIVTRSPLPVRESQDRGSRAGDRDCNEAPTRQNSPQMPLIQQNDMIETFPTWSDQSLTKRVGLWEAGAAS